MDKTKKVVILGTPHGRNVAGKCSPDRTYYEYRFGRELAMTLRMMLEAEGWTVMVDWTADLVPASQKAELQMRCDLVNAVCNAWGADNCIYVSMHTNAAGDGWNKARGWCVYTSPGRTKGDVLADHIWKAAKEVLEGVTPVRQDMTDGDPDYEAGLYVLKNTRCASVLTENLFHDNQEDLDVLQSMEGMERLAKLHMMGIESYFAAQG